MGTGGRPGITFKSSTIVREHDGEVILVPSIEDRTTVINYFKEYSDRNFIVNATIDPPAHDGDSGSDQNQNDAT